MSHCKSCSNSTDCNLCESNYILTDFTGNVPDKCKCDPNSVESGNCNSCFSPNNCSICEEGYYNENGQCILCDS